jgi:alkanesulfonate monooxygenase SsuD/methylene tetrahydromethanopterin reductase-like flavin-dependent oxidoreductase (luciferase family)
LLERSETASPIAQTRWASLSALSGGRIVFGIGAGGLRDQIANLGVPLLGPRAAVREMEEARNLVRALSGGGGAVLEHGARGLVYRSTDDTPPAVALGRWASEVVPAVRAPVAKG